MLPRQTYLPIWRVSLFIALGTVCESTISRFWDCDGEHE